MTPARRILPLFIPHLGCPHACVFCDQKRITGAARPVTTADVTESLSSLPDETGGVELAFYGGSFTSLPAAQQSELLGAVQPAIADGRVSGIRISTRPDAISEEETELLRANHVQTVELGVQSMDDAVLRRCGRGHSAEDTRRSSALLRQCGFHLILQMMTGLPGSSEASDIATAKEIASLRPDGVRIYPTVILRGTELERMARSGEYREHTVADAVTLCARIVPIFDAAGIPVIRLGLNPTEELSGGEAVGGAYHPALGELVRSRMLLESARRLFYAEDTGRDVILAVNSGQLSQMIGQHRCNITALQTEYALHSLKIVAGDFPPGTVKRIK